MTRDREHDWRNRPDPMEDPPHPDEEEEEPEKDDSPRTTPTAITEDTRNLLFKARTLIISGEINQKLAANVIGQLLAMDSQSDEPITIYINSQGGHVESGDTIHDIVRYVRSPVRMVGTGWVASAGALIYVSVPKERRFSLPHTRYLLHQPAGGMRGSAADIEIEAREILSMRERLNRVFAEATGQALERIEDDTRRNFWLSAEKAVEYGLVGRIISGRDELA
ncbi:MAG TPA: ATP-dependent Clp protease proteolytic subunit [Longimicrobiales bacterium]|nr:ATP-dependent Clp protease proteolytic subunit [Longimicrobiales bacterium]